MVLNTNNEFVVIGFAKESWGDANQTRKIFKDVFDGEGLEYYNPHSFRDTLVRLGEQKCTTPEEFKV